MDQLTYIGTSSLSVTDVMRFMPYLRRQKLSYRYTPGKVTLTCTQTEFDRMSERCKFEMMLHGITFKQSGV